MPTFAYDVFISYSSADAPWAEKLEADLVQRGLTVFRDRTRLQLGDTWSRELTKSVHSAQHMIVLWSDAAAVSDWVNMERSTFFLIADPSVALDPPRRLIAVMLQGSSPVLSQLQSFDDLRKAGAYTPGAAAVDPVLWTDLLVKVAKAVKASRSTIAISTLVFTITKSELTAMDPARQIEGLTLEELLQDFTAGTPQLAGTRRDLLLPYYGSKREDWKPFGQNQLPIRTLLDQVFVELNQRLQSEGVAPMLRFHMEWIEDDFFTDKNARASYLMAMRQKLTLLVIDAVPLCDLRYQRLFNELRQCLANDLAAVVVLPPFPTTQQSTRLHAFLREAVREFASFYSPPIPASPKYAHFGLSANDGGDIGRLIQQSVGHFVRSQQPTSAASGYLRSG